MNKKKTLILGITGSFGTGKTTCARMFKRLGASVIDADRIYRQLIKPKRFTFRKIVSAFGPQILGRRRQINRKKIAKLVFSSSQNLKELSRITHPDIIRKIKYELCKFKKTKKYRIIVIDAPLLIEAGLIEMVDKLIVVKSNKKNQIARIKRYRNLSRQEIIRRIKAQVPLAKKIKLADFVIDNSGTIRQTQRQIKDIWKDLKKCKI